MRRFNSIVVRSGKPTKKRLVILEYGSRMMNWGRLHTGPGQASRAVTRTEVDRRRLCQRLLGNGKRDLKSTVRACNRKWAAELRGDSVILNGFLHEGLLAAKSMWWEEARSIKGALQTPTPAVIRSSTGRLILSLLSLALIISRSLLRMHAIAAQLLSAHLKFNGILDVKYTPAGAGCSVLFQFKAGFGKHVTGYGFGQYLIAISMLQCPNSVLLLTPGLLHTNSMSMELGSNLNFNFVSTKPNLGTCRMAVTCLDRVTIAAQTRPKWG
ncbi:hypothetical protein DFH06DRAFT_1146759 [Mycena polygramma]|nr:hypothetical protein DFH06DRAFT_1146759 [Mycena polygramma]